MNDDRLKDLYKEYEAFVTEINDQMLSVYQQKRESGQLEEDEFYRPLREKQRIWDDRRQKMYERNKRQWHKWKALPLFKRLFTQPPIELDDDDIEAKLGSRPYQETSYLSAYNPYPIFEIVSMQGFYDWLRLNRDLRLPSSHSIFFDQSTQPRLPAGDTGTSANEP